MELKLKATSLYSCLVRRLSFEDLSTSLHQYMITQNLDFIWKCHTMLNLENEVFFLIRAFSYTYRPSTTTSTVVVMGYTIIVSIMLTWEMNRLTWSMLASLQTMISGYVYKYIKWERFIITLAFSNRKAENWRGYTTMWIASSCSTPLSLTLKKKRNSLRLLHTIAVVDSMGDVAIFTSSNGFWSFAVFHQ